MLVNSQTKGLQGLAFLREESSFWRVTVGCSYTTALLLRLPFDSVACFQIGRWCPHKHLYLPICQPVVVPFVLSIITLTVEPMLCRFFLICHLSSVIWHQIQQTVANKEALLVVTFLTHGKWIMNTLFWAKCNQAVPCTESLPITTRISAVMAE